MRRILILSTINGLMTGIVSAILHLTLPSNLLISLVAIVAFALGFYALPGRSPR